MARTRAPVKALAALSAAGMMGSCGGPAEHPIEYRRNVYASAEACQRDYPNASCENPYTLPFSDSVNEIADACRQDHPDMPCDELVDVAQEPAYGPWYALNSSEAQPGDPGPGATAEGGQSQVAENFQVEMRGGFGDSSGHSSHSGG